MFAVDNNHNYQNAMKTTLLTLATALLMASAATAQNLSNTSWTSQPRPWRFSRLPYPEPCVPMRYKFLPTTLERCRV